MTSTTVAGTALFISEATPPTYDAAGYGSIDFEEIGGIEKIGTIGATIDKIDFQPLKGPKDKHKGPVDYGSLQPSMAVDEDDVGQGLVRAASDAAVATLRSFMTILPTGALRYFRARVFGFPEQIDGAATVFMATPTIEILTPIVKLGADDLPSGSTFNLLDPSNSMLMGAI